jgi:hypothetical protein
VAEAAENATVGTFRCRPLNPIPTITSYTHLTLEVGIILIFKHAALLCLSGIPTKLALTQAESDYQKSNVASQFEEHLAPYQDYSFEQSIGFLINTHIGLSSFVFVLR